MSSGRTGRLALLLAVALVAIVGGAAGAATAAAAGPAGGHAAATGDLGVDAGDSSSDADTAATGDLGADAGDSSSDADTAATDDVVEHVTYRQLPDGGLEATITYRVPESVRALEVRLGDPADLRVVETDGFERRERAALTWDDAADDEAGPQGASGSQPTYGWDGATEAPTLVVQHEPTRDEPATYAGGTEDWAVVLRPATAARWRFSGTEPDFRYEASVEGPGAAGERFLVLGPQETYERTAGGQTIRLVVPEAAELASPPERVLDALADASERLAVGHRDDVVTIVAAPTDGVEWAHGGLSLGPDARVAADVPVTRAPDLWVHEYVHTRQRRDATTAETQWLVEATAEYYAATAALERGAVDFDAYRGALERGARGAPTDAVLTEPAAWSADAEYRKGALVVAAIDRELRLATDGEATFQDVVAAWNEAETFDEEAFLATLEDLGGPEVRSFADRHTRTNATPALWGRDAHQRSFGAALAAVSTDQPTVEVRSTDEPAPLALDDLVGDETTRLVATVPVHNDGDAAGEYRLQLRVDGAVVDVAAGELAPGESRTVRLEHRLETDEPVDVDVDRPGREYETTVDPGGSFGRLPVLGTGLVAAPSASA